MAKLSLPSVVPRLVPPPTPHAVRLPEQADCGYATIDGGQYTAELTELARWSAIITNDAKGMDSRMENRLCRWVRPSPELCWCNSLRARGRVSRLVIRCADGDVYQGLAYNERCFGTLG